MVGGGPAGLTAAREAAARGGKVLLLELQSQIGGSLHSASWAPPELLPKLPQEALVSEVNLVRFSSPRKQLGVKGDFGAVVSRHELDKQLAAQAVEEGVEVWVNSLVEGLVVKRGFVKGVKVKAEGVQASLRGEVTIDASGCGGTSGSLCLREILGRGWDREQLSVGGEYLMANASARGVEIYFNSYYAPLGHLWVYPLGKRFALVGARGLRIHPHDALDEFVGRRTVASLVKAVPIASFRGQLPLEGPLPQTSFDGALAVGGAAGQVYGFSGEGLKYALECGRLAGEVAMDAVAEGDVSAQRLAEYDRGWREGFEAELRAGRLLRMALRVSPDRKTDELLEALGPEPKLQKAFVNVFLGSNLKTSLRVLLSNEEIARIFGDVRVPNLGEKVETRPVGESRDCFEGGKLEASRGG